VDAKEIRQLEDYFKRLFGNAQMRVVPKKGDDADVMVGEERIGGLTVDDEDDDRSYNLEIKIAMRERNLKALEAYLQHNLGNENIRVQARPKKNDSAEVYLGEEYIGVLFFDDKEKGSCFFEMAILGLDLEEAQSGG
jgi:hypothetical protein